MGGIRHPIPIPGRARRRARPRRSRRRPHAATGDGPGRGPTHGRGRAWIHVVLRVRDRACRSRRVLGPRAHRAGVLAPRSHQAGRRCGPRPASRGGEGTGAGGRRRTARLAERPRRGTRGGAGSPRAPRWGRRRRHPRGPPAGPDPPRKARQQQGYRRLARRRPAAERAQRRSPRQGATPPGAPSRARAAGLDLVPGGAGRHPSSGPGIHRPICPPPSTRSRRCWR